MNIDPKKYRIKESIDSQGASEFSIQKKTFWWWVDLSVNHIVRSRTFSGSYDKYLGKVIYKFSDLEDCKKFYANVLSWKDRRYKGKKIIKTWESHDLNNYRYVTIFTNPHTFKERLHIEYDLDEIIHAIDRRTESNKKKSIFHNL